MPSVKPYRKRGLENYELLGDVFNTTTATGQLSFSSSQVPLPSDEDREVEDNFINSGVHVNVDVDVEARDDDEDEDEDEVDQTEASASAKKKGKRPRRSVTSSNNRRKNKWDSMDSYFEAAKEVMTARLEKVKAKSSGDELLCALCSSTPGMSSPSRSRSRSRSPPKVVNNTLSPNAWRLWKV